IEEGQERPLGIPIQDTSDMRFSPDGRTLAVSSHRSREIILWVIERRRPRMTLQGHSSSVVTLAFARDGRSLASAARLDAAVLIWDLATGRPRRRLSEPVRFGISLAYSPDRNLLAIACLNARPFLI